MPTLDEAKPLMRMSAPSVWRLLAALSLFVTPASAQHRERHHHRHHRERPAEEPPPAAAPAPAAVTAVVAVDPPPAQPAPSPAPAPSQTAAPAPSQTAAPPAVSEVSTEAVESTPWTIPWRTRPLTLPARVLRLDAALGLDRSVVAVTSSVRVASTSLSPWLRVGASYGLTSAVELGLSVTPLRIEAGAQFQDVFAYGRFRLLHREGFDVGASVSAGYRHHLSESFIGSLALLLRWRTESIRIDLSPSVDLSAGSQTVVDLRIPVDLWWQIAPDFALGFRTGIIAPGFTDTRLGILAGARAVYSLPRDGRPFVDLYLSFDAEPLIHLTGTLFRDDFVIAQLGAQVHFGP